MFKATTFQKLLSYLLPVKIWEGSSAHNPALELFLHKGEWQLATEDAVYSDGSHYRPLKLAFGKLKGLINSDSKILVLGAGLGSAVSILDGMHFLPEITLVDIDDQIIRLNRDWLFKDRKHVHFVLQDAEQYVAAIEEQFDILVIDIFKSRVVPEFVAGNEFLAKCKERLRLGGTLIVNYIINDKKEWETFSMNIQKLFPTIKVYDLGINRVLIATI